ncbi:conserved Plasmodium protein, unknown function [Plasmodium vivax]|uniref:Uncharacterized protein n=1 Tax=Plasmodium vivax TaxID=5855 RepID=A0A564ZMZ0_PLAVI|nr:conserved Plasmodium protein, unknown function [Plasmodium vivax]
MEKLKGALKGICSQLNSDSEKEIERGLKGLYGLIKNNGDLAEEDYNMCVDFLIENNYLDVIIFVLSIEAAKTKGTKSVHNINLRYVEIIFYSLNWVLRNKLGKTHPDDERQNRFVKSEAFRNVGLFLCEQMNLLEIAILSNFSYNRIFILNVILHLFLFHEKFHFVLRSSSLILNLIELKKNLKTVSELKRKNELTHLEDSGEELDDVIDEKVERAKRESLDGEEDESVPTGDESLLGEASQNGDTSEGGNSRDTKKGRKNNPTRDGRTKEDETLLCSYNFKNEVVLLYKHLLYGGAAWVVANEREKNREVENCEFYAEMLVKKRNGKTKMFKEKIVDRKRGKEKRKNRKRKRSRCAADEADPNCRAVGKADFDAVRVAFLVMCAYCYLDSTRSDKIHTYFHTICEEIRKIYCSSGEELRHYVILCLYKILEKSETYKNMNVFFNVIKLVGIFFNDVQSEMDPTVLFFINELLKRRKFSEIYKNAKFNCNCIFLLKGSHGEEDEAGQEEKRGKKRRSPCDSSPTASSYYLTVNCNRKDGGGELANMHDDLFDGTTNMQSEKYAQVRNKLFVMGVQKRDIRRICLIFANLEMYIATCIRETKQYLITRNVKEDEEVILLRDKSYNDEKQIQNKVNNAFLSFLTDLKIKFFINHYIVLISIEKYQHFINLYYGSSKLHVLTCDDNLFLFLLLFVDVSKIFFVHRTNGGNTHKRGGKEMGRLPTQVSRYFSLLCSDMQVSSRSGTNVGDGIAEVCHDEGTTALATSERKRKMGNAPPSNEEGDNMRRKKKKLERSSSELVNNRCANKSGEASPTLLQHKYAYQRVNSEVVRNTNFLQLCGEVIHYKVLIELHDAVKEGSTENSEGAIIDRRVVMQNVKEANSYLHHLENELNYKKKIEEVLFFFIPVNVTKYIVEKFTKRDKQNYYNYFIICYLHYTFEIYKCVSMFVLSLDSFLPFPQGVNKIVLMNRIKEDLSLAFYNLVSSYYLFDIAYINRYIINEIKGAQNNEVGRRDARDGGKFGKRNNLPGAGSTFEVDPSHDSDSDDYTFNIGAKDHEMVNARSEKNQEKREHILQLHYFLNDVHIYADNLYVYHFMLVTNFVNLFDDCELKKKLLNELYSQKRIIEIRSFELFANVNENVYGIFLKLFFEKCYFPLESYHLLDNLFPILAYYKKRVLSPNEECSADVPLAFYSFVETLLHRMLRKTKFFDSPHVDDVLLFLNFLRAIRSLRQFVVALSVFCRLFNLHRSRAVHLDRGAPSEASGEAPKEASREVSIEPSIEAAREASVEDTIQLVGKRTNEFPKEKPLKGEASPFFGLLVELLFTSNLNFALKGIPIMKVIKEEKQTKGGAGDAFDYTLEDIVQVYVNYLDYVKYVLLLNPYVYPSVREKLKNQRSLGELFCAFTRKKDLLQTGENPCDSQMGGTTPSNSTSFNQPSGKPQSGVTNMVEGSQEKVAFQNEANKQKAAFITFATFLQSVDAFLGQIEKVQMGQKSVAEYREEIKQLCSEARKEGVTNEASNNRSGSFFFMQSDKHSIERDITKGGETMLEIYLRHNNVASYYTSVGNLEGTKKKCEEAELVLYNLCNVSTLIVNYFFTTYVYLNGDGNVLSNTLLHLIEKISKTVEVFLTLSANVNTIIHAFVERTRRYEDVKNVIASCGSRKEQGDQKYDVNNFFQKVRNLTKSMCSLFVHIFKNGLFVKLLNHLQKGLKTNRVVLHHFAHLILCYVGKSIQLFNLKRERHRRLVGESLVRLIHIIAEEDIHKGDEQIRGKLSLMILSLLQMLDGKECFMRKLIVGSASSKGDRNQTESDPNGGEPPTGSCRSFLLKQIALFFVNLMRSEKERSDFKVGLKNGIKGIHRSGAIAVPLLIDTITRDERLEGETGDTLNELCKLYVKKWYGDSGCPLSCAIVERVIRHGLRGGGNGTSDRSTTDRSTDNHCFFRGIKNERTVLQQRGDVEREVEAHILQNYVAHFDLKAPPEEAACSNAKENHIFMIFLYLLENKYTHPLFDQIDRHLLESVTHEEVFRLPRKNFSAMLAEIYLKKFAHAYKSVCRRRNRISFLLLSTKKAKNKNCLFIALSVLYFLGNMLSRKERMIQLRREYGKDVVRRICEVAFFYFYGYFYKNDIPKGERMMRCYERVTFFVFKGVFKSLKRGGAEGGRRNSAGSATSGDQNGCVRNIATGREHWRVSNSVEMSSRPTQHGHNNAVNQGGNGGDTRPNESFPNGTVGRRNDRCILLVLLLQMLNQNVGKFNLERMVGDHLCDLLTDLAFCARGKKNHFYYENAMKNYMYIFSEHDVGDLKKDKKLYAVFYAFFLLLKYVKLRNLGALTLVEAFFRDAHVGRLIVQQLEEFRGERGVGRTTHGGGSHDEGDDESGGDNGDERNDGCGDDCHHGSRDALLFVLKLVKIFYEEWYDERGEKAPQTQAICLKTLNRDLFNALKRAYRYTLESVDVHIRSIFFVDISHYLKSVTMESILDNQLIDEVLKFKEFNLNNDGSYDWLNMNTSMLNKTCLYFYLNENVRRKLESGENHFLFYLHMNKSGRSECCEREVYPPGEELSHDAVGGGDADGPSCVQSDEKQLGKQKEGIHNDYHQTDWKMQKGELLLKRYKTKLPHCIMSQNECIKREAFFLAHRIKLEDNIYDYLFLLCLIVSKLIFCFVLMAEKLRIFFYHFRILYTSYRHENVFLNFDLLNMQEINRKIKSYIRKYPDIHFYIDYDNNEDEERGGAHGRGSLVCGDLGNYSHTYDGNNGEADPHNSYNGGVHRTNEHTKRGFPFGSSNKLISYDEEKEHFYHLKKNEKSNSNCKFCIKFKQIHSVHRSTRILDLLDKEEKTNIKNMIYYGKTIRTSIFMSSPYEGNAYKNCSTFREEPRDENNEEADEDTADGDNKRNGVGNESGNNVGADPENSSNEKDPRDDQHNDQRNDQQNGVEGNHTERSATKEKTFAKGKLAKMKKNHPSSSINADCIVDSSDLLYGRKMKEIHFKKNYKKLLKRYLLNDIDFFGKWIKTFSMNALKILIFCLSSNDIIVRMISIKGLSIFYQLIENSFVLYKIRKRLNSFRRSGGVTGQAEEAGHHGVMWKNSLSQRYHNSGSTMHSSAGRKKKQRMLVIPFKELFYLFFFMKKLKYSVDPNSYYINPCVSTYSFFLINDIYKKKGFRDSLKNLIRNKTFSVHFFHAYLDYQFRKTNFTSLNVINFLIISTQALFSTRYDLRGSGREIEGGSGNTFGDEEGADYQQGDGQNYDEEDADYQRGDGQNYDEGYADHRQGGGEECNGSYAPHKPYGGSSVQQHDGGYSTRNANYTTAYDQNGDYVEENPYHGGSHGQRKSNTIDRSFFATSNVSHRMVYDFQNEDDDGEEANEQRNGVANKEEEEEEEATDKLRYIQGNHKNAIKTILNILNKNNIFEIYLTMFFSNYLNYNLLKKFLILLVMCSGVLPLEDMPFDCVGGGDSEESRRNGGSDGEAEEQQNGGDHVFYGEGRAQENGANGVGGTNQNNCDVAYYVKNNLVLKLISRNNILLWLDRMMHQKLFQDEIAFYYPSSFTMPVINVYDTDGRNEGLYLSTVDVEADCSGGKGEGEVAPFGKWGRSCTSNKGELSMKSRMHNRESEGGSLTEVEKNETGKVKATLNDKRSSREEEEPLSIVLSNQTHIGKMTKNRYIMGYVFKESYEKTSEIFFYLSLFVSNIVSNLFYPSVDYANIFTNALLKKEKKKIKRFILNNAQKVISQKGEPSKGNQFELWNFWYSNFHKYISLKVRSTFIIGKEASHLKKTNLNTFSDLIKIIKNLNRSLYYIFINLFHKEYFNLFIKGKNQGVGKESAKQRGRNLTADHTTNIREMKQANLKTCRTFIKYIFLMFNNLFNICTSLFDRGVPNGEFAQNSISTKVAVEESFLNEDLSFVLNEVMVFLENVVVLHSYFSSYGLRKTSKQKNHLENKQRRRGRRAIGSYYLDVHNTLLKRTYAKSPNRSNYAYYRKIIQLVLHMLRKKCYNENKHFGYIFLNKLITVYHFLEGTSRAKVYLYIYELFRMTKRNPLESLLNQVL